jgi:asparagine synthetase B (glutamine-hydrolysing)
VRSIVYQQLGDALIFGETSDVVLVHPLASGSISGQALYDYLYFHMIPAPATVYREHARLQAGHALKFARGNSTSSAYWRPRFSEPASGRIDDFKPAFRAALNTGVASLGYGRDCGAFLSGGTDSSTIAGLLGTVHGAPARTYSIGFSAAGYDEIHYARIAARHFATDHHEYYVTPDDVAEAVQLIAAAFDQPFGNASVIPTYFCARLGHADGVTRMLGGDGGDELFGGNSRYARRSYSGSATAPTDRAGAAWFATDRVDTPRQEGEELRRTGAAADARALRQLQPVVATRPGKRLRPRFSGRHRYNAAARAGRQRLRGLERAQPHQPHACARLALHAR